MDIQEGDYICNHKGPAAKYSRCRRCIARVANSGAALPMDLARQKSPFMIQKIKAYADKKGMEEGEVSELLDKAASLYNRPSIWEGLPVNPNLQTVIEKYHNVSFGWLKELLRDTMKTKMEWAAQACLRLRVKAYSFPRGSLPMTVDVLLYNKVGGHSNPASIWP